MGEIIMGMTITEKILARASGVTKVSPGDVAVVDVETACLIDLSFLPEGWRDVLKVADPSKVVIVFDHLVPAPTAEAAVILAQSNPWWRCRTRW
jgi:3-isopropylmalate/(R)-2-methylmalate dehydratase large subunit